MLKVGHGDALWIEYGTPADIRRVLIDAGPHNHYDTLRKKITALDPADRKFELFVITHIDTDHIDGAIRLLQDDALGISFKDIWFNCWRHVADEEPDELGAVQGEFLGALLSRNGLPWNRAYDGKAVVVEKTGDLPRRQLCDGLEIILLSPGRTQLDKLKKKWKSVLKQAGFSPGDTDSAIDELKLRAKYRPLEDILGSEEDTSPANGSSIAFLLKFKDRSMLLASDAFEDVLTDGLRRYTKEENTTRVELNEFKLPHHGSASNISMDLLQAIKAERYLISTNGDYYKHPDKTTIQLICEHHKGGQPELVFNYLSKTTKLWADASNQARYGYRAIYPV